MYMYMYVSYGNALYNALIVPVPNDHGKRIASIIISEEQGYNEDQ